MKIKKTWFSAEIEITPQEILDIERNIHPASGIYQWLGDFLNRF